jgi:hypothetical protein
LLKLKLLALIVAFGLSLAIFMPSDSWPSFKMVDVEWPNGAAIDDSIARSIPDINAILQLRVPDPAESDERWRGFLNDLMSVRGGSVEGKMGYGTPLLGFLTYVAEHKPALLMEYIESGQIEFQTLDGLIQRGVMVDWRNYSSKPNRVLRESQMALLRLANDVGIRTAQNYAKEAFLDLVRSPTGEISLVNLRFALEVMSVNEREQIYEVLQRPSTNYLQFSITQLKGIYSASEILNLVRLKESGVDSWKRAFEVDALLLGDGSRVLSMLNSKVDDRIIEELKANGSKETHERSSEKKRYCVICILALGTDGLIGKPLIDAHQEAGTTVVNTTAGLQIERAQYSRRYGEAL